MPCRGTIVVLVITLVIPCVGLADNPAKPQTAFTDLMKPEEFKKCGLEKLDAQELAALNEWVGKTYVALAAASAKAEGEINFYDKGRNAVAYLVPKDEMTIYLWTGEPVAYVNEESVYGFNGKHLGWFEDGMLYDSKGKVVLMSSDTIKKAGFEPLPAANKGLKNLKPLKGLERLEPLKPLLNGDLCVALR